MTTSIAYDPGARVTLALTRKLADDGQEQLAESVLRRLETGELELSIYDDDGDVAARVVLREGFLDSAIAHGRARRRGVAA